MQNINWLKHGLNSTEMPLKSLFLDQFWKVQRAEISLNLPKNIFKILICTNICFSDIIPQKIKVRDYLEIMKNLPADDSS
jgi:hypothetical protein